MYSLYLHCSHFLFYRQSTGGCIIEETSQILKAVQHCAQQELATQTGDTDSEEDGLGIYIKELEYQEPYKYEDKQLHQDDVENALGMAIM